MAKRIKILLAKSNNFPTLHTVDKNRTLITFRNLAHTTNSEILACFNLAFSDYSIPFKLTIQQLESKIAIEDIDKNISVGAFSEKRLVGFVLHGSRIIESRRIAYNGGTGVIPTERGQALTYKMYKYILPILKSDGYEKVRLEVISTNVPAIKSYQKIGFGTLRQLACFKGELNSNSSNADIAIREESQLDLEVIAGLGELRPSWQNSNESVLNLGTTARQILAYSKNELIGYCILNSGNNRILQIAVKKEFRKKHVGRSLLNYVAAHFSKEITIINVDSSGASTIAFLENNNLDNFLSQLEMELLLSGSEDVIFA